MKDKRACGDVAPARLIACVRVHRVSALSGPHRNDESTSITLVLYLYNDITTLTLCAAGSESLFTHAHWGIPR